MAAQIEGLLAQTALPEEIEALGQLLDAFAAQDFAELPLEERTALVHAISDSSPEAKLGVRQLRALTFLFFYGLPDENGQNPNWEAIGYPGPLLGAALARAGAEDDRRRAAAAARRRRSRPTCASSARAPAAA